MEWRKPKSITYSVRYVMDGSNLYISGDLGEVVFNLTWRATPESFKDINLHYFHSKLAAIRGNVKKWDSEEAERSIDETIEELEKDIEENEDNLEESRFYRKYISVLEEIKKLADDCTTKHDFMARMTYQKTLIDKDDIWIDNLFDALQEFDNNCWEWIFNVGDVIPIRVKAYLVGLKMAADQLNDKKLKGDDGNEKCENEHNDRLGRFRAKYSNYVN